MLINELIIHSTILKLNPYVIYKHIERQRWIERERKS